MSSYEGGDIPLDELILLDLLTQPRNDFFSQRVSHIVFAGLTLTYVSVFAVIEGCFLQFTSRGETLYAVLAVVLCVLGGGVVPLVVSLVVIVLMELAGFLAACFDCGEAEVVDVNYHHVDGKKREVV